jgi:glycerophosphoryl diester phosphodiesterase
MEAFLKRPIAHRGLHDNIKIVENTIESFELAMQNKFAIECDIVLSKDGEVMVFHDYDLNRLAAINKPIKNCTASELKNIKLLTTNSVIPSVDEILYKINGEVPILIEIKKSFHPEIEERLFEIIRSYDGEIAIHSYDIKSIKWFQKNAPFYKLGLISNNSKLEIEDVNNLGVDFLSFEINILESDIVKKLKDQGFHILTWTVDTPEKYQKSLKFADNCIFEKIKINKAL